MKNKLLYVHNADFSKPAANKIQVLNMCKAFKDIGVDILLVGFKKDKTKIEYFATDSIKINYLFNKNTGYILRSFKLIWNLRQYKTYKTVFTRDLLFGYLASIIYKKKVIYELHEIINSHIWKFLFKLSKDKFTHIISISKGIQNELKRQNMEPKKIKVLPDGVDLNLFDKNISKIQSKKKFNLTKYNRIILYTGSFQDWKGIYTLINAANKFKKNTYLVLVGGKKEELKIDKLAKNIIILKKVKYQHMPALLKCADVLVIPNSSRFKISAEYTSPLKLFEYMAAKRPIVASNLKSIRKIVTEKEVTFFQPDSPDDLFKNIQKVLKKEDKSKIRNCQKKIKEYTWEKRAKTILEQLIKN